jgi:hypothetical protein
MAIAAPTIMICPKGIGRLPAVMLVTCVAFNVITQEV